MSDSGDRFAELTRNQLLLWGGHQLAGEQPLYNEAMTLVIHGAVDRERFNAAFQAVVDRTDVLRTVIQQVEGRPQLRIRRELKCVPEYVDLSAEPDPDRALRQWAAIRSTRILDLSVLWFDSALLRLADDRFAWFSLQDHILSDATSQAMLFERVASLYETARNGLGSDEYPSFADYAEFLHRREDSPEFQTARAYWQDKLKDRRDPAVFYEGRSLASVTSRSVARERVELDAEESARIREVATRRGLRGVSGDLTLFSLFAGVLLAYLYRMTGNDRLALGVAWQNRPRAFARTMGLLMEEAPFFATVDDGETFGSLARKVQAESLAIMRHLPYGVGNPGKRLYDVRLNFLKASLGTFAGHRVEHFWWHPGVGDGSLALQIHDFGATGRFTLEFDFNTEVFPASARARLIRHVRNLLEACVADPSTRVSEAPLLSPSERERLLGDWNATGRAYPREHTVLDLFEAQAARTPAATAVSHEGQTLTYGALAVRAGAIAGRLRQAGVGPGVLVGVCLERSADMVAALLGILKAGGAYVPLDPAFPAERLTFMLDDSGAPVLLTETRSLGIVGSEGRQVVCLDTLAFDEPVAPVEEDAKQRATPEDLAYVLYTSGSTGRPKGVEISHRALTNFLSAMRDQPGCTASDVVLAVTTLSFDIAGLELWLPLICGGQVEMVSRTVAADGRLLRARLDAGGISVLQATPVTWRMLIEAGWTGTPGLKALIGGEALPPDLVAPLLERTASLWNMYGPTETTIWSSVQQVTSAAAEITVGRPIANTTFYILDAQQQPVPVGVAGELYIGGDGLARGYHGRPELTAEKFVPHPFVSEPGARLYRTGDLAKYRADGRVVHLGRLDHQVKIRGFRIELGEIEAALGLHPGVRQAAVVARDERPGQAMLVAYWVADVEPAPTVADLRTHLKQTLPDYMVPQHFVALAALPLTPNGKIDRKQLPAPDAGASEPAMMVAPRTSMEVQVAVAFAEVLQVPAVSVDADFFDLGGQSLLAIRLMSRLEAVFQAALPLQLLFEAPTVAQLSERIAGVTPSGRTPAPTRVSRQARTPVQRPGS